MKKYLFLIAFIIMPFLADAAMQNSINNSLPYIVNSHTNLNIMVGQSAGAALTSGTNNAAVGDSSLAANTTGSYNVSIGSQSLLASTTGSNNTSVGAYALTNSTASGQTAVGDQSLVSATTGTEDTAVGTSSLNQLTTGQSNTGVGYDVMFSNVIGNSNTALGNQALYHATGSYNTAVGDSSLNATTTGQYNTCAGTFSCDNMTTTNYTAALGYGALGSGSGDGNTAIGYTSLQTTTGGGNTAVGYAAGYAGTANTTGTYNTFIGYNAQANANNYTNSAALGNAAVITASNQVQIGNSSVTDVYLGGGAATLHANGVVSRLYASTAVVGNGADATEDTLQTYSMPANTLSSNGDRVRITGYCLTANNSNLKTMKIYFGASNNLSAIEQTGTGIGNHAFLYDIMVMKTGSSTQIMDGIESDSTINAASASTTTHFNSTGSQTDSSPIVIKLTGQSGASAANDIVCDQMTVEFISH